MPTIAYIPAAGSPPTVATLTAVTDPSTGLTPTLRDATTGDPVALPATLWNGSAGTPVEVVGGAAAYGYAIGTAAVGTAAPVTVVTGSIAGLPVPDGNARPTTPPVVTVAQAVKQLQLGDPTELAADDAQFLSDLIDAATEYAEQSTGASLLTRTITKTFEADQVGGRPHFYPWGGFPIADGWWPGHNRLPLARGPVQAVTSIVDGAGIPLTGYRLGREGKGDFVAVRGTVRFPVTVAYVAGYGPTAADVPSDVRMAIRSHVAAMWRMRSAFTDRTFAEVPQFLTAFYAGKRRSVPVA